MKQQDFRADISAAKCTSLLIHYRSIMNVGKRDVGGVGGWDDVARWCILLATRYCLLSAKESNSNSKLLSI